MNKFNVAANSKREMRKYYLEKRRNINPDEKMIIDGKIQDNAIKIIESNNFKRILIYVSREDEISTKKILTYCLSHKLKTYAPRCGDSSMDFHEIFSHDKMVENKFGIFEPPEGAPVFCLNDAKKSDTLIIIPAVCVSQDGYRIGYGKGYYDKYLSKNDNITTAILTSENLMLTSVAKEDHDIPGEYIITENNVLNAKSAGRL